MKKVFNSIEAKERWLAIGSPLVVAKDSFDGKYCGAKYFALAQEELPNNILECEFDSWEFWDEYDGLVGLGNTEGEAISALHNAIRQDIEIHKSILYI